MCKKPPLGIKPRYIILEKRRDEILRGIDRYVAEETDIPYYWIKELYKINDDLIDASEDFKKSLK